MGRFQCSECGTSYYDKRFIWEPDKDEDGALREERSREDGEVEALASTELLDEAFWQAQMQPYDADTGKAADGSSRSCTCVGAPVSAANQAKVIADTVRATGTAANITGSIVHTAGAVCAPISSVAGVVGAVGGASQLYRGLYTPSRIVDPHLVTKGGITTGVGSSCMVMGAFAGVAPPLFVAALSLGVAGLCCATVVDAMMGGLCPECREREPLSEEEESPAQQPSTPSVRLCGPHASLAAPAPASTAVASSTGGLDGCFPFGADAQLGKSDLLVVLIQQVRQQRASSRQTAPASDNVAEDQVVSLADLPCMLYLENISGEKLQCLSTQALLPLLSNLFFLRGAGVLEVVLRSISAAAFVPDAAPAADPWQQVVAIVHWAVWACCEAHSCEEVTKKGDFTRQPSTLTATTAETDADLSSDSEDEERQPNRQESGFSARDSAEGLLHQEVGRQQLYDGWELEFLLRESIGDLWAHLREGDIAMAARAVDTSWAMVEGTSGSLRSIGGTLS